VLDGLSLVLALRLPNVAAASLGHKCVARHQPKLPVVLHLARGSTPGAADCSGGHLYRLQQERDYMDRVAA
jgi:hypothetical protein